MFLTRGDLWLNWVHGEKLFRTYLIDGDWAVNAGNWLWVSSSAFEKSLNYRFKIYSVFTPRGVKHYLNPQFGCYTLQLLFIFYYLL